MGKHLRTFMLLSGLWGFVGTALTAGCSSDLPGTVSDAASDTVSGLDSDTLEAGDTLGDLGDDAPTPDGTSGDAAEDSPTDVDGAADAALDDGGGPPTPPGATTFEGDRVIDVAITLPSETWDALRTQGRTLYDILPPTCLDQVVVKPFTWFSADVVVDGAAYTNVGIRKKGFLGSLSNSRPSLKLRFDKFVDGLRHDGLKRMTLNNNRQDASRLNTCLAYDVMRGAGVPAPRCNYAHVTVNGDSLGVYSHVDSMKKPFLRQHFEDDEGTLYENQLADLREGWTGNLENKTVDGAGAGPEIDAIVEVLEEAPDAAVIAQLAPLVDMDAFVRFWAAEVLVAHWDGFAGNLNNSYMYSDPTSGKLHFLPWGPDAAFQGNRDLFGGAPIPQSVMAQSLLTRRLYADPAMRGQYVAELQRQLDEAWDEGALTALAQTRRELIAPFVLASNADFAADVDRLLAFIAGRRTQIGDELAVGPLEWTVDLRSPPCWSATGSITASGSTSYGTLSAPNIFAAGTGTLFVDAPGVADNITAVGSKAGAAEDALVAGSRTSLQIAGERSDGTYWLIALEVPTADLAPGAYLAFDLDGVDGYLTSLNAALDLEIVARFFTGGITVEAYEAGGPVTFSLTGDIYGPDEVSTLAF